MIFRVLSMGEPIFGDPRFDASRNALYHAQRRSFFDLLNRISSFITIIFGTAVVSKIGDKAGIGSWVEVGTVFFATL